MSPPACRCVCPSAQILFALVPIARCSIFVLPQLQLLGPSFFAVLPPVYCISMTTWFMPLASFPTKFLKSPLMCLLSWLTWWFSHPHQLPTLCCFSSLSILLPSSICCLLFLALVSFLYVVYFNPFISSHPLILSYILITPSSSQLNLQLLSLSPFLSVLHFQAISYVPCSLPWLFCFLISEAECRNCTVLQMWLCWAAAWTLCWEGIKVAIKLKILTDSDRSTCKNAWIGVKKSPHSWKIT